MGIQVFAEVQYSAVQLKSKWPGSLGAASPNVSGSFFQLWKSRLGEQNMPRVSLTETILAFA
jgi:hypothetical protein